MDIKNIKNHLSRYCDFQSEWHHKAPGDQSPGSLFTFPVNEMGFIRCDHNGHHWSSTPVVVRKALFTKERAKELDAVADAFFHEFRSLTALEDYCVENAEDLRSGFEYNLYLSGELCNYWIRVNTQRRNYNLYIHAIIK